MIETKILNHEDIERRRLPSFIKIALLRSAVAHETLLSTSLQRATPAVPPLLLPIVLHLLVGLIVDLRVILVPHTGLVGRHVDAYKRE